MKPGWIKCPACGRFMRYDAYYARWQCMAAWCGRTVTVEQLTAQDAQTLERTK